MCCSQQWLTKEEVTFKSKYPPVQNCKIQFAIIPILVRAVNLSICYYKCTHTQRKEYLHQQQLVNREEGTIVYQPLIHASVPKKHKST